MRIFRCGGAGAADRPLLAVYAIMIPNLLVTQGFDRGKKGGLPGRPKAKNDTYAC